MVLCVKQTYSYVIFKYWGINMVYILRNPSKASTEPVALKDFCKKIYEARKTTNEKGETIYLFDMDTMGNDNKIVRRIFITKNGEMTGCTFVESDYAKAVEEAGNTTADSNGITLGGDFVKAIFEGITKSINEMWDKAAVYENVNYDNILSKI